jgi:type II restriction/modification system DNA methylase subunit YeeA
LNTTAIEKFASSARTQLMESVRQRLHELKLTPKVIDSGDIPDVNQVTLDGRLLTSEQVEQWHKLVRVLLAYGYDRVVEHTAYTWFNRFVALRYMEVNGYLPTGVRVLSAADADPADQSVRPDIIKHAISALPVDERLVREMRMAGDDEALYRYLLLTQCAELASILPFLFDPIEDWLGLLFPRNILAEGSVIRRLVAEIPEEDWQHVEIVGWLYQYYIAERKDEVYAGFKKNKKATKHDIPAATQLFTPNWIVRYMVDNSLGRLWLESRPESKLRPLMEYYIDEAEQDPDVRAKLKSVIRKNVDPSQITVMDPACGSGHILVYGFDLLYEMYLEAGYPMTAIPRMILERNLYGLDIDERASQLAAFALMMKARAKDPHIFFKGVRPNIFAIKESNSVSNELVTAILDTIDREEREKRSEELEYLLRAFRDASEYGSLIRVEKTGLSWLPDAVAKLEAGDTLLMGRALGWQQLEDQGRLLLHLVKQAKVMAMKYDVVVTNPPYMGARNMGARLKEYLSRQYDMGKSDLFAAFIIKCLEWNAPWGISAMITQHSWMFLSAYNKLRKLILNERTILSMLHLGARAFDSFGGEVVQSTAFTVRRGHIEGYKGSYGRFVDYSSSDGKRKAFKDKANWYLFVATDANHIPGSPIAYWASEAVMNAFDQGRPLGDIAPPRQGMATSDNDRFLRLWHEVKSEQIGFNMRSREEARASGRKWFPYNKGGEYRKWYGNNYYVVDWENDGSRIRDFRDNRGRLLSQPKNMDYYFLPGITWTDVSPSRFGARYVQNGFLFDVSGSRCFPRPTDELYVLSFLCSKLAFEFLKVENPTLHFQVGDLATLPLIFPSKPSLRSRIEHLTQECIDIAKRDWDSFETSWDFVRHPFLTYSNQAETIEEAFEKWSAFAEEQFQQMKRNEEEINRLFLEIYGLEEEMSPEVSDEDITIRRADRERDVRSFISYAVGCMMGRYSLDEDGLVFAGGKFDPSRYRSFKPDPDGVLPVLDDNYFQDDIVGRFVEFVKVCFGPARLEENLDWIAARLGRRGNETSRDTIRRYFLDEFYRDHVRTYRKRPIYWMFSSGRQKGFQALIYMHRYQKDTVALVRTKYLLELESRIDAKVKSLQKSLDSGIAGASKTQVSRIIAKLERQLAELRAYDEEMHSLADEMIEIDLNDGVKENYAKFAAVLEAIK